MSDWAPGWLVELGDWIVEMLTWWPRQVWEWFAESLAELVNGIPVPTWVADLEVYWDQLGAGTLWLADVMQVDIGVPLVLSAYALRFLIRRLPVIG
jgi:hypothetical protein